MKRKKTVCEKALTCKKTLLYVLLAVSFPICMVLSFSVLYNSYIRAIEPQLSRAAIEISQVIPEMELDSEHLQDFYDSFVEWQEQYSEAMHFDETDIKDVYELDNGEFEAQLIKRLLWKERIGQIKVGHDGYIVIASRNDGTILNHPDKRMVGKTMCLLTNDLKVVPLNTENVFSVTSIEDLSASAVPDTVYIEPFVMGPASDGINAGTVFTNMIAGCVLSYQDVYIICGIGSMEILMYIFMGQMGTCILFAILWVFVRYAVMLISKHEHSGKTLRSRLVACATIVSVIAFLLTWYLQTMSELTSDLKTMEKHAKGAVEMLDSYDEMREDINQWLDERYLTQCRFIAELLTKEADLSEVTRDDLKELAELYGVRYIYVFDKFGRVSLTNSPYNNFELSKDPDSQSYAFRKLLYGVESVIQPPMEDDASGECIQYIGVSLRDADDLCNGFVQIAIDPEIRSMLTNTLQVETVLSNLVVGLPDYAIAVDKETDRIAATTGISYSGESKDALNIKTEDLKNSFSGFLTISGKKYLAGYGESKKYYLIPIAAQKSNMGALLTALQITLLPVLVLILMTFITLFHYQRNIYEASPKDDCRAAHEQRKKKANAMLTGDDEEGLFSGLTSLLKTKDKYGMEERWKVNVPKEEQSPEMRVRTIINRLLFLFCVVDLLPPLYYKITGSYYLDSLYGINYVITGNWEKGLNLFAFSSCMLLLCGLYVLFITIDWLLYQIARISDMRVETVCLLLRSSLKYICGLIFIYYGLSQFGIPTQTLLASAGMLSLLITFGAKDLVSDVIAGFFIIFEGTIKVGDFVTLGDWYGLVKEVGIRTTKITWYGETKIINNSEIREIINANEEVSRMTFKFQIPYHIRLTDFEMILEKELPLMTDKIPGLVKPPKYQHIDGFEPNGVTIRIAIYMETPLKMRAIRALRREIKLMLERYNIEAAYEHSVFHKAVYEPQIPEFPAAEPDALEENSKQEPAT